MVGKAITRLLAVTAALAVGFGFAPAAAQAAPKAPPAPNVVVITGKGVAGKITIDQKTQKRLFDSLYSEVSWMATAKSQTTALKADKLGTRYVVTLLNNKQPLQIYELYPLAAGGPRAHRVAKQPTGTKTDGWFYGRLTMPEALRVSGVPLETKPDVVTGGIGGGIGQGLDVEAAEQPGVEDYVGEVRRLFLLNGAVLVSILVGLAGIAFLIRRKI
ncbi:hypothetical protein AB0J83_39930 [Actinoplanes sp. NPDC049596]|uniref:hypothetical protein n=1 Tax=unclassified Actinoplanes TaxID=2626549 RepID=UPI0034265C6B